MPLALSALILALRVSLPNSSPFDSLRPPGGGPILCYVSDRRRLANAPQSDLKESLLEKISAVAAAGVEWIQLREKDLSGKDFAALAHGALRRVSALSSAAHPAARILLNDRLDVALAENAGGVHLGEDSLPVHEAKRLLVSSSSRPGVSARLSRRRFLPFVGRGKISRLRRRQLHFLRPRFCHALKSCLWRSAGYRSPRRSLSLYIHSSPGYRRNHPRERVHLFLRRRFGHRRHPAIPGFSRSRRRRAGASPPILLTHRPPAPLPSVPSIGATAEFVLRDRHRAKPLHRFVARISSLAACPALS